MWRGAKIGAASLGLLGFVSGITVCIAFKLPFPPLAVTEIGALLGGCLGAMAGYASCFPAGKTALQGLAVGAVLGIPVAVCVPGTGCILAWAGCLVMCGLVGYQAGCGTHSRGPDGWTLYKG